MVIRYPSSVGRYSTRLMRKGVLAEETYRCFNEWNLDQPFEENIEQITHRNTIGAANQKWLGEVTRTLTSRFSADPRLGSLIRMAREKAGFQAWLPCLAHHIGRLDLFFRRFATEFLFDQYQQGTHRMRTEHVAPFVEQMWREREDSHGDLSAYGQVRMARDLLLAGTILGILEGKAVKSFKTPHLGRESFLYVLHSILEDEKNPRRAVESPEWRVFLLTPTEVERELFSLHQYRVLHYETAGSLCQLSLPHQTLDEYVRSLTL